jgi:hypothetical protein
MEQPKAKKNCSKQEDQKISEGLSSLSFAGLYSAVKYFDSVKTATCVEI